MNKIFMLLYLFVDVNIMERNRQKQTLCQAAAARRRHQLRIIRTIYPLCRYQRICRSYQNIAYCWPQKICKI